MTTPRHDRDHASDRGHVSRARLLSHRVHDSCVTTITTTVLLPLFLKPSASAEMIRQHSDGSFMNALSHFMAISIRLFLDFFLKQRFHLP
jgi:hypothetical protein